MEDIDGVHHINIYSKGNTEIGRWLTNFSYSPIQIENGRFNSVEGYWYWLTTLKDQLRELHGFAAKKLGKESEQIMTLTDEQFKEKICKAIDIKLKINPRWVAEQVNLPLQHYYDYGGKRIYKKEYDWITEHIQGRVGQLREYYGLV